MSSKPSHKDCLDITYLTWLKHKPPCLSVGGGRIHSQKWKRVKTIRQPFISCFILYFSIENSLQLKTQILLFWSFTDFLLCPASQKHRAMHWTWVEMVSAFKTAQIVTMNTFYRNIVALFGVFPLHHDQIYLSWTYISSLIALGLSLTVSLISSTE